MLIFLSLALGFPWVAGLSNTEEWADFADNFSTDLAPLISLFGEQVTKQFLSESISIIDCILFGMAPLGILTAVVSVIRLYGKPWLKSLVGRAQEPYSIAQAELCSSTNDDVCELWSNGSICRVFGRPKILEFIYFPMIVDYYNTAESLSHLKTPTCGIYLAREIMKSGDQRQSSTIGYEFLEHSIDNITGRTDNDLELNNHVSKFSPFPNLSLNIKAGRLGSLGGYQPRRRLSLCAALFGILLQGSFFVYATWASFYNPSFYAEDDTPQMWYFVLAMTGTVLLVCGMSFCALLIEKRSIKRHFSPPTNSPNGPPRIHWLQRGNQRVADQQFGCFAYSQEAKRYTTSFLAPVTDEYDIKVLGVPSSIAHKIALVCTLAGFSCQFVGLRGLHGSITLYQLACTLVMAVIRASLRGRRVPPEDNRITGMDSSVCCELDWQALDIVCSELGLQDDSGPDSLNGKSNHQPEWGLVNMFDIDTGLEKSASSQHAKRAINGHWRQISIITAPGKLGCGIVGFVPTSNVLGEEALQVRCIAGAVSFLQAIEGEGKGRQSMYTGPIATNDLDVGFQLPGDLEYNPAVRAMHIRARLAHLTGGITLPAELKWDPELEDVASRLQSALQNAAAYILREVSLEDRSWRKARVLIWSVPCAFSSKYIFPLHFAIHRKRESWFISEDQLVAVMSLWRYTCDWPVPFDLARGRSSTTTFAFHKIFQVVEDQETTASAIRLWVGSDCSLSRSYFKLQPHQSRRKVPYRLSTACFSHQSPWWPQARWEPYQGDDSGERTPPDCQEVPVLGIPSGPTTLLAMMAQDIFASFMYAVASIVGHFGDFEARQVQSLPTETILRSNATSNLVGNIHIDALVRILCQSGLATEEIALMTIVPALFHQGKLPSIDAAVAKLVQEARKMRNDGNFKLAESLLKRLLRSCPSKHHSVVAKALGELYRAATRSPTASDREFGFRGMASLRNPDALIPLGQERLSQDAQTTFASYSNLADFLKRRPRRSRKGREVLDLTVDVVDSLREQIVSPRTFDAQAEILILMEKYDLSRANSSAIQELLLVAISLGYVEVIEELRDTNHHLITELVVLEDTLQRPKQESMFEFIFRHLNVEETWGETGQPPQQSLNTAPQPGLTIGFLALIWAAKQLEEDGSVTSKAEEILRAILDWVYSIHNPTDQHGNTPLMWAIDSGNLTAVEILLDFGVDLQDGEPRCETLLSRAVSKGYLQVGLRLVEEYERRGRPIPEDGLPVALSLVLRLQRHSLIKPLLLKDTNAAMEDPQGITSDEPVRAISADPELVAVIIKHGEPVPRDVLPILLQTAIDFLEPEWIRRLHDLHGEAVLRWCYETRIILSLLKLPSSDEESLPPAHPGPQDRILPVIEALLDIGVDVTMQNALNNALAVQSRVHLFAALLRGRGISPEYLNNHSDTVHGTLFWSLLNDRSWTGTTELRRQYMDALLKAGCDPDEVLDVKHWRATPLQTTCVMFDPGYTNSDGTFSPDHSIEDLSLDLLRAGAAGSVTASMMLRSHLVQDNWAVRPQPPQPLIQSTPLELACLTGKAKVVDALLDIKVDANTYYNRYGEFGLPLHAACLWFGQRRDDERRDVGIIRALLYAGANVHTLSGPCGSALIAATFSLLPEVVKILRQAGARPCETIQAQHGRRDDDGWQFRGLWKTAWAALEPSSKMEELTSCLRKTFARFQTNDIEFYPYRDVDDEQERRMRIREIFMKCCSSCRQQGQEQEESSRGENPFRGASQ
ncbi:hypothetical protein VTJ83DRAFT_4114 [Remersonia thermophila]|uniref:Uncharacterized protein n=1 Tax=Remersonia thermophila TaxID=72144 RepID=A0ABR4DB66_9PEZI